MSDEASPDPMGTDIHYPCGAPPETGVPLEIAQGVHWVRLPLPASLGAINVWLLADDDSQALVDTGIFSEDSVALWEKLLAGPLVGGRLTRILATHLHPDHVGMAGWLTRRTGCRLWMTRLEYLQCRMLAGDTGRAAPEDAVGFYHRAGWDDQALAAYGRRFGSFGRMLSPCQTATDASARASSCTSANTTGRWWLARAIRPSTPACTTPGENC